VDECERNQIPKEAYVLDGGFLDIELMDKIEGYGQAWVCRLAKNRLVQLPSGKFDTAEAFAKSLSKEDFKPVEVETRLGVKRTYWVFAKNIKIKFWELSFVAHTFLEMGLKVDYPEGMPVPKNETIGQKARFMEMKLLQSFINLIQGLVLEKQDPEELLTLVTRKRLNRLAC
jgi:hypothetical protein